ncbi:MAG TPA: PPC domain-containing protein, partial [Longimicrobium sp.]|nr:PPC domain-containing protein [Longimicrobium sp.]
MRQIRWYGAAAAVLAACASAPAQAQNFPVLRLGQTVNGTLAASDPKLSERGHFKVYRFDAQQGQRMVITMRSKDFDAYLTVARVVGGITDKIKEDDDRGGDTDARIRFTAEQAGSYLVIAQALAEDGVGAFTVALERAQEPTTAQPRAISLGMNASGTLAETDAILDTDDTYYDTWTFAGRQGQRLVVDMKSTDFDPFLSVGRMENGEFN